MSSENEKSAPVGSGLTITRPAATRAASNQSVTVLTTIEDVESTHSLTPSHSSTHNEKSGLDRETSPYSAFYNHSASRTSIDKAKSESKQNIHIIPSAYDTDVEAGLSPMRTGATCGKVSLLKSKSRGELECTVWPGQSALKQKKKEMRRQRGKHLMCCGWMTGLSKKNKIYMKILIALVVVGIAVGVGVGISRAVGGGVWKNSNAANAPISHS